MKLFIASPLDRSAVWLTALVLFWVMSQAAEAAAQTVISEIRVSSKGEETEIEVTGSKALSYMLREGGNPFEVTLLFLNATFAFPSREHLINASPLRRMATRTLEREGSRLAELNLVFSDQAPYTINQDGPWVRVRIKRPLRSKELVWSKESAPAAPAPKTVEPPTTAPSEQNVTILRVRTGGSGGTTTVSIDASGPLTYNTFTLERPPRVVIDFEGVRSELRGPPNVGGHPILQQIRLSEFRKGVIRIVLELRRVAPYWIERKVDGIVIHLGAPTPRTN